MTSTDLKDRWGGLLKRPWVSKIHRNCLDGFKIQGLGKILGDLKFDSVLDVCCGLGEFKELAKGRYVGLDNSLPRIGYAKQKYEQCHFFVGDARRLPIKDHSFDLVMMVDTSHHLCDDELGFVLGELGRVSKKYIVISDPIVTDNQSRLSTFFYSLDRGANFRAEVQMKRVVAKAYNLQLMEVVQFKTFPGLYVHAAFILTKAENSR